MAPAAKPRRISFPGLGRLRFPSSSRKNSLDGGSASSASLAPAALPGGTGAGAAAPSLLQPSPSLPGGGGAPEPLSMQAVVFGVDAGKCLRQLVVRGGWLPQSRLAPLAISLWAPHPLLSDSCLAAVRRGVDTLGVPPAAPTWWLTGADPLAAMMEQQAELRAQIARWGPRPAEFPRAASVRQALRRRARLVQLS